MSCLLLLPLGPPPLPLPFSTSHSLCPSGGLPLAARAPCSNSLLKEKSKLNEFRLVRRILTQNSNHTRHNPIAILLCIGESLTLTAIFASKALFNYALISRPNNNNKHTSARFCCSAGLLIPTISSTIITQLGSLQILIFQYTTKQLIRIFVSLASI